MSTSTSGTSGTKKTAGAFDIRNIIAALIGFYGIVLILMGLVDNDADAQKKTGDINANLWAGIVPWSVVALGFCLWTRSGRSSSTAPEKEDGTRSACRPADRRRGVEHRADELRAGPAAQPLDRPGDGDGARARRPSRRAPARTARRPRARARRRCAPSRGGGRRAACGR